MKRSQVRPEIPAEDGTAPLPVSMGGPGAAKLAPPLVEIAPGALRVPHDPVNERILLAAAWRVVPERRAEMLRDARPEHFFGKGHAAFWACLAEMQQRGLELSLDTVRQLLGETFDQRYFGDLIAERPDPPPNLRHHLDVLRWDAARVEAAQGPLADLLEQFRDPTTEPVVLGATARRLAEDINHASPQGGTYDVEALLAANRAAYEARILGDPVWPYGIDGFERDPAGVWRVKPGAEPGYVTVVTGVSGSGKSIIAKAIAVGFAKQSRRTLFGAWEEMAGPTLEAFAQMSLGLDRNEVDESRLAPEVKAAFYAEQERFAGPVHFVRKPPRVGKKSKVTIESRIDWVFNEAVRMGAHAIVFDLFSRMFMRRDLDEEVAAWEYLQDAARDTGIHAVATHQQRLKDVEGRPDPRPTREGSKGSASVVEVADTMIGVFRPAVHRSVPDDTLELILLKQRKGRWPFAVRFDFDPVRVQITKGREVAYLRPGEDGLDDISPRPSRGGRSRS